MSENSDVRFRTIENDPEMSGIFIQLLSVCTRYFSKMKVLFIVVAVWLCVAALKACKSQQWRGHTILCCANGTALINQGKKLWVAQKPVFCAPTEKEESGKNGPIKILGIILLLACCGMQCFCIKWKKMLKCLMHKEQVRQNDNQPPKQKTDENKEVAIEMRVRSNSI